MELTKSQLAPALEATLLTPDATREAANRLASEARELGCAAVCVSPSMLPLSFSPADATSPGDTSAIFPSVATVAGFPSGKHASLIKATEARFAVEQGAVEVEVVVDVAAAIAADQNALLSELMTVREAVPEPVTLKVVLESAALSAEALRAGVRVCVAVGADYVVTSTGFHHAGGASVEAVRIIADELRCANKLAPWGMGEEARRVAGLIGVKAAGGIREWAQAVVMVEAGATRVGSSCPGEILA